jgi:hypothetical protein
MRLPLLALFAGLLLAVSPARADAITAAVNDAIAAFALAQPQLPAEVAGVDVAAYGSALTSGRFLSRHWGGEIVLDLHESADSSGACARYVAYVALPPRDGSVRLTICPRFSAEGTDALRRLTILHEMVHVVAGPDECRAMVFAAQIELLASGSYTPVERYWEANDCPASGFRLP